MGFQIFRFKIRERPFRICTYCISANSFRGNYSFLNLTLCTVNFNHSTYRCGNYSREETIRGNTVYDFFCDFWRYPSTYPCPMYYICTIYPCTVSDFPWHNYLPKYRPSFMDVHLARYYLENEWSFFIEVVLSQILQFPWKHIHIPNNI